MKRLAGVNGTAARALEFTILTAARTGEVIGAEWSEIDVTAGLWTIPAGRMKGQKEHRVPLSSQALAILSDAKEHALDRGADALSGPVFPGMREGQGLSNSAHPVKAAGRELTERDRPSDRCEWGGSVSAALFELAAGAARAEVVTPGLGAS